MRVNPATTYTLTRNAIWSLGSGAVLVSALLLWTRNTWWGLPLLITSAGHLTIYYFMERGAREAFQAGRIHEMTHVITSAAQAANNNEHPVAWITGYVEDVKTLLDCQCRTCRRAQTMLDDGQEETPAAPKHDGGSQNSQR